MPLLTPTTTISDSLMDHHRYESDLRLYLEGYLAQQQLRMETARRDLTEAIAELHRQYLSMENSGFGLDVRYILKATNLLVAGCLPAAAS